MNRLLLIGGLSLVFAAGAGFLTAASLGTGQADPTRTVTIEVSATGATGPTGPQGPPGGAAECPTGFSLGFVQFNTPGGHQTIYTCLKDA